jgi:hypothetical protein
MGAIMGLFMRVISGRPLAMDVNFFSAGGGAEHGQSMAIANRTTKAGLD